MLLTTVKVEVTAGSKFVSVELLKIVVVVMLVKAVVDNFVVVGAVIVGAAGAGGGADDAGHPKTQPS